jgi:YD repeat-containing protein
MSYSNGTTPSVSYGYDPDGNKVSMTDGTGTSTWTYDVFGDVTSKTTGAGTTVSYSYDNAGNQTSITYPGDGIMIPIEAVDAELESDTPDVGLLIAALDEGDVSVRARSAQVIGKVFGYRESPPPDEERRTAVDAVLARWGREKTAEVRSTLAQTLALLGDPRARPVLETALTDGSPMVRNQAAWGLRYLSVREGERLRRGPAESRSTAGSQSIDDCLLITTTVHDGDDAVRLAREILDTRLAASVQLTGGVRSMSWFDGDRGDSEEWQLAIVTTGTRAPELERFITENHPYGEPIIMVCAILGNKDFLSWVNREVRAD